MPQYDVVFSLVRYNNSAEQVDDAVRSCLSVSLKTRMIVVDNSSQKLSGLQDRFPSVDFVPSIENVGFGTAHNLAIKKTLGNSKYHVVINPDVYFPPGVVESLYLYMEQHPDVGIIMPKVTYPDGRDQHLCRLEPTPFTLIARRFLPSFLKKMFRNYLARYEFRDENLDMPSEVPCLSGCFMFIRDAALEKAGLFDEKFFLYLEDVDLCRRVRLSGFRTVYFPQVSICHHYAAGSYKLRKLLILHIRSAITYFNKWGWFPFF